MGAARARISEGRRHEQVAALKDVAGAQQDTKLFGEPERATLALTTEMTRNIEVAPAR